jgi:hypothetical protein
MVIKMSEQNYCMINQQTNVCDNVVVWDGNPNTWTPPAGYLMLVQATTPAKNWVYDEVNKVWSLQIFGFGQIGFTWDGTYLTTNEPQPAPVAGTTGVAPV